MFHLTVFWIAICFLVLAAFCLLAAAAFSFLQTILMPGDMWEERVPLTLLVCNLPICIAALALILLIVPASYGLLALVLALVLFAVTVRVLPRSHPLAYAEPLGARVRGTLHAWRRSLVTLTLTLVSFAYFDWAVAYMRWPPPGDVMSLHGPVTTYLVGGGYAGVVRGMGYLYPFGFHLIPAVIVAPLGLYPGEAVFVFGAFIAALIAPMMYVLARRLGATPLLALLAFSAAFVVHPSDNLEKWILGPFFNGPYPNLLGYLLILPLAVLQVHRLKSRIGVANLLSYARPALFYALILLLVYPSFAILVVSHLVLLVMANRITAHRVARRDRHGPRFSRRTMIIAGGAVVAVSIAVWVLLTPTLQPIWKLYSTPPPDAVAYSLDTTFFSNNVTGVLILVGVVISLRHVVARRQIGVGSFYLTIAGLLALSLNPVLYWVIWPILPSRTVIVLGMLAWPMCLAEIEPSAKRIWGFLSKRKGVSHFPASARPLRVAASLVAVFAVLLAVQASTYPAVNALNAPLRYGWLSTSPYFSDDFHAIEWLAAHAGPTDLVLSDGSFVSRFALSIAILNLSHVGLLEYNHTLIVALNQVWVRPGDVQNVSNVLKQYDVQYVLSASEPYTLNRQGPVQYVPKPFAPAVYAGLFDSYPFLQIEYKAGDSRVYRVIQSALSADSEVNATSGRS